MIYREFIKIQDSSPKSFGSSSRVYLFYRPFQHRNFETFFFNFFRNLSITLITTTGKGQDNEAEKRKGTNENEKAAGSSESKQIFFKERYANRCYLKIQLFKFNLKTKNGEFFFQDYYKN